MYSHYISNRPKEDQLNNLKGLLYRAEKIVTKNVTRLKRNNLCPMRFMLVVFQFVIFIELFTSYKPKTEEENKNRKKILTAWTKYIYLTYPESQIN